MDIAKTPAEHRKYPRSVHQPASPGYTPDDIRGDDDAWAEFVGREAVASIKLDGEATSFGLTTEGRPFIHARSVDGYNSGPGAPTRDWMRRFFSQLQHDLPRGWVFCGESCVITHSLRYTALPSYFFLYNIWDDQDRCLSWDETEEWAQLLGIQTVPVVWRGTFDQSIVENLMPIAPVFGEDEVEGYVVRTADGFTREQFQKRLLKWVRSGHVRDDAAAATGEPTKRWEQNPANELAADARPWPGFRKRG